MRAGCLLSFYYCFLLESPPRLTEEQPTDVYELAGGRKQTKVLHVVSKSVIFGHVTLETRVADVIPKEFPMLQYPGFDVPV